MQTSSACWVQGVRESSRQAHTHRPQWQLAKALLTSYSRWLHRGPTALNTTFLTAGPGHREDQGGHVCVPALPAITSHAGTGTLGTSWPACSLFCSLHSCPAVNLNPSWPPSGPCSLHNQDAHFQGQKAGWSAGLATSLPWGLSCGLSVGGPVGLGG